MPRPTLSSHMKDMKTYSVLLTQTTEADLLAHMKSASQEYEARYEPYHDKLERILETESAHNPYRKHKWRESRPTRKYQHKWAWNDWGIDDDEEMANYYWLGRVRNDMIRCDREFKWSENPLLSQWANDFLYQMEKCMESIRANED